jgi:hypothetical protein
MCVLSTNALIMVYHKMMKDDSHQSLVTSITQKFLTIQKLIRKQNNIVKPTIFHFNQATVSMKRAQMILQVKPENMLTTATLPATIATPTTKKMIEITRQTQHLV